MTYNMQLRRVLCYDALAELVAVVTETVPELLAPSQRAELVLGLRARLILELCKADGPPDLVRIQANLEKIHACSAQLGSLNQEEVFPVTYGRVYDQTLRRLLAEFLSRLEQLLPNPTLTQVPTPPSPTQVPPAPPPPLSIDLRRVMKEEHILLTLFLLYDNVYMKRRKGVEEEERIEEEEEEEREEVDEAEEGAEQPPADKPKGRDRRFLSARPENPPHTEAETRCPRCGKSFLRPNQLKTHLKLHALPYRCLPCEKGFGSKSGYYQHQRLHRKGRAFPCGHCPLSFLCRYSLRQHERTHTEGPTHLCPECGKRFSKVSMVRHMRMHAGQKDFLCPACGKSFLSSGELLLHTRTHTRDTPYTCTLCGKGFTTKSHLVVHGRSHSGERPYPCAVCPKRFITVSCLKRHMLSHDGVKPFSCPRCPKEFSQIGNLRRHMGTHPPPPPPPPHEEVTGDT
uniref:Zinc finger protein 768-like n=1 Tax=Gadus morhua TaxID=8049 RepID=A0A8C5FB89_GADMO